jgi:hypothetical protein
MRKKKGTCERPFLTRDRRCHRWRCVIVRAIARRRNRLALQFSLVNKAKGRRSVPFYIRSQYQIVVEYQIARPFAICVSGLLQ